MHAVVAAVTERIIARSRDARARYLDDMAAARDRGTSRGQLSCGNLAHGFAAAPAGDKLRLRTEQAANIGIITAYNDMLSAHQPLGPYPDLIKEAARTVGATAQIAGGVPAMCDGVTQGQPGMELSLFSRDVIAMATAVSLSHNMFDAALCLGVCDKIVPGLMIGALRFGHLPVLFVPAGPMPSGLPNKEKARIRALFAEGKVGRDDLLEAESQSYHSPGTCTFYGTANSNQMLMEVMGVHLPGTAFVNPGTPLRDALTRAAATHVASLTETGNAYRPLAHVIDEKAVVNGIVGLLATGGSTNHTLHLPAMARAAGVVITWEDFEELSRVVPLMTRIYPNGSADVNHFHAAGGMGFLVRELLAAGLLHDDVETVMGRGLHRYAQEPYLQDGALTWRDAPEKSQDTDILRGAQDPFDREGGVRLLTGGLGQAIIKVSAVAAEHRVIEAPAAVFTSQEDFLTAFKEGRLDRDHIAVVVYQGPKANGMPELHKLSPSLSVLQDRGFKVALVTDGRMSGASGKTPAAIHVTPEAADGGLLARLRDGDILRVDAEARTLTVLTDEVTIVAREPLPLPVETPGWGRELFASMRAAVSKPNEGASVFF